MNRLRGPTAYRTEALESLSYLLVLCVGVLFFGFYLRLDISTDPDGWSWVVEQSRRGARAPGGAAHPLVYFVNYLLGLVGQNWPDVSASDFLMFCHRALAALGLVFLGWYLLQRFQSLLVAIAGMLLVGFSAVYWHAALSLSVYQLGLTLLLGALCCVGRPAYGRRLSRIRDWVALILFTAALMASQNFIIFLPAFLCAASDDTRQRGHFLLWAAVLYLISQAVFFYQYVIGPSELFSASSTAGKVEEWFRFQSPEEGRLRLPGDAGITTVSMDAAISKTGAVLQSSIHSIMPVGGDGLLVFGLWFLVCSLGLAMVSVRSARRDVLVGLLIIVPLLGVTYLQSYIVAVRYLPLSVGVALVCCSFLGFVIREIESSLRWIAVVAFLGLVVPALFAVNYAHLTGGIPAHQAQQEQPTSAESNTEGLR